MNEDLLNWGMVVRNCSSTRRGRVATCRLRTPIHFKNCTWDNTHFWIYAGERRPRPRNVIFGDTYLSDPIALNMDDAYDVLFRRCRFDQTLLTCEFCDDVRLDDVAWVGSEGIIIDAIKTSTVYLDEKSTRNGSADISPWVR